jgi:hypothetical protein
MGRLTTRVTAVALVVCVGCGTSTPSKKPQSAAALEQILAPIALYPDQLLAQMLLSATDPTQVTDLHAWLETNKTKFKGTKLQDAAVRAGFDASFVALVLFPDVVARMAQQIAWTTFLGNAFTTDRNAVFDVIQRLRLQAKNVGTLKTTPQQAVQTKTTPGGQQVIVIEPANPQVVYVPQYNPEVVYTQAPSATAAPAAAAPAAAAPATTVTTTMPR